MPIIRGLDNELHTVFMHWNDNDEPLFVRQEVEDTQLYVPTASEQAMADRACFGSYDETGGEAGNQENYDRDPHFFPVEGDVVVGGYEALVLTRARA